jgi:hypothetical protein
MQIAVRIAASGIVLLFDRNPALVEFEIAICSAT